MAETSNCADIDIMPPLQNSTDDDDAYETLADLQLKQQRVEDRQGSTGTEWSTSVSIHSGEVSHSVTAAGDSYPRRDVVDDHDAQSVEEDLLLIGEVLVEEEEEEEKTATMEEDEETEAEEEHQDNLFDIYVEENYADAVGVEVLRLTSTGHRNDDKPQKRALLISVLANDAGDPAASSEDAFTFDCLLSHVTEDMCHADGFAMALLSEHYNSLRATMKKGKKNEQS